MQMPEPPRNWIEAAISERETNSAHALERARDAEELVNEKLGEQGQEPPLTNIARAMSALEPDIDVNAHQAHVEGGRGPYASLDDQVLDVLGRVFLGCDHLGWDLTRTMHDFRENHRL